MKFIILFLSIILVSSIGIQSAWAPSAEPTFVGNSRFQKLPVLHPGETANFTMRLWLDGPFSIYEIKPVIDVYPVNASSHIKIETETLYSLVPKSAGTIHGTITADHEIPLGKIFLSAYFLAKDAFGRVVKGGWPDPGSSIDVQPSHHMPAVDESGWKTYPAVGKYLYSDPPKPDQIFKVQYRMVNGTLDSIISINGSYSIEASTVKENGLFELKIPLNYPSTNFNNVTTAYVVIINNENMGNIFGPSRLDECFFGFSIPFSGNVSINLAPGVIPEHFPYHGEEVPTHCIKETILSIPPLQQLKAGISAGDVKCKEGMYKIIKRTDESPACVKPETAAKLRERGWGMGLHPYSPYADAN